MANYYDVRGSLDKIDRVSQLPGILFTEATAALFAAIFLYLVILYIQRDHARDPRTFASVRSNVRGTTMGAVQCHCGVAFLPFVVISR